ncbi:MAG: glycoside hydrolase family 3 C-terminal domain-containing protein [Clostridia bacterium]|nr:glycoside hydrolase family 3 C-terminal domain-containing protein [Clostridia bacterium]
MKDENLKNLNIDKKALLFTGADYWNTARIDEACIPSVRFSDGPTGVRAQKGKGDNLGINGSLPATCFPTHSALACSWNKSLLAETGARIGGEAAYFGVDVLLAPDLNIKRNPLCGRNFEYFSEDPYLNGKLGAAYASGVASSGTGACLKHFAANNREHARMVCDSVVDGRTLREVYLTAFEIAVKESKPAAVMTAYNRLNGVYCNENNYLLETVLRGEWGFGGIVVSDWGGTHDRVAALCAGADVEMPKCKLSVDEIKAAANQGELNGNLDICAERIANLARRQREKKADSDFEENARFAKTCADECAVLLKNDGALPVNNNEKVALIGCFAEKPLIQGGGSSKVNPKAAVSLYSCLKDKICGYARGYKKSGKPDSSLSRRALKLCKKAEKVVFCFGLPDGDCEGADRQNLNLPENQISLFRKICTVNKNVVAVIFSGSVVDTSWDERASAVLLAGLAGQSAAQSVADILYGKVNPSGKLTETYPVSLSCVPSQKYFNESAYFTVYGEGMDVGYRHFCDRENEIKYPFGFGLSYTQFNYNNLTVTHSGVNFDITNTGKVYGGEVAQVYISFPQSANAPKMQLKGFEKVFLNAGESKRVYIPFDGYTFRSYDADNKKWVTVSGRYQIYIGSSSADFRLEGYFDIEGDSEGVSAPDVSNLTPAPYEIKRTKRGRVIADIHTPFCELKNARGLFGRLFSKTALSVVKRNKTVYGSLEYLPLRTLAQFGGFKKRTINRLIRMFNGVFFKDKK